MSAFEVYRRRFQPRLPPALQGTAYTVVEGERSVPVGCEAEIERQFPRTTHTPLLELHPATGDAAPHAPHAPLTVGVIFSGGQAAGGHNVLCGLYDKLQQAAPGSKLLGFLGGPKGLMQNKCVELTAEYLAPYRNMGGFHAIGSGRDKISTPEQFDAAAATAQDRSLDALVIVGGDDSNTNACVLAEDFLQRGIKTTVVGCPKTIDRDLYSTKGIECSFGFDSATKVYSSLIGNLCFDCLSAKKYWHFVRLMGRSASHITLECGLQTHPNITLVGEELLENQVTARQLFERIAAVVEKRSAQGKNYGVCLIPEGIIEFIPENNKLFDYLNNTLLPAWQGELTPAAVAEKLPEDLRATFLSIPEAIRAQLLLDRDPHGNIAISQIESEKYIVAGVRAVLAEHQSKAKFSPLYHFFGYEGRCCPPSNFDCSYCYGLGAVAAILALTQRTGYMASIRNIAKAPAEWQPIGLPLTALMTIEQRHGKPVPVIMKQMVDLQGRPYHELQAHAAEWAERDCYQQPGPIQCVDASDPEAVALLDRPSLTVQLEARQ